jgi:hypothetical protein
MNISADKKPENKSQSAAHVEAQNQLQNTHSEKIQLRKSQETDLNDGVGKQPKAWQEIANNSPQAKKAAQFQAMANQYSKRQAHSENSNAALWTSKVPTQPKGLVQRMVAFNNYHNVYAPSNLEPDSPEEKARMRTSINTLTQRNDGLVFSSSSEFNGTLTENIDPETKKLLIYDNKYVEKEQARTLTAEASKAQQNQANGPDQRKAITDQLGLDLNALTINPTWAKKLELGTQFSEEKTVYLYPNATILDNPYTYPTEFKLIAQNDMIDAPGVLGAVRNPNDSCAIDTISDLGGDVHDMWDNVVSSTNVDAWHTACRTNHLDYRNDNEYIKILMKLDYTLVQNDLIVYNEIDWTAGHLGNGNYFLGTGAGDIGHAIGVTVAGGVVTTIHDRQHIHTDDESVKYIFKQ